MIRLDMVHAALLAGMHKVCFAEPWNEAAMAGMLAMPGSYGFLAAAADRPQGFILCRSAADEAEVLTLLVLPGERRHGLAKALLAEALAKAQSGGAASMFLEVAANNQAALALYTGLGFLQVGRRPRYYGGQTDALILRKALVQPGGAW